MATLEHGANIDPAAPALGPAARAPVAEHANDFLADIDTQLILQYAAGRSDAANALIRRNLDRVTRFVARVVRDPRVIEDLVQDVFVHVLTRAGTYTPSARFSTWLYRVATNTALSHLRQRSTQKRKPPAALAEMDIADAGQPLPEQTLKFNELRERLAALIDELPPNQRIALVLFETEDFTYHQIAHVLSVTVESVRALLMRARTTLRRRLGPLL